jgi:hydrogenase maturation protease
MKTNQTLVLGIGNTLLSDEGAGIHVINYLRQQHPSLPNLTYVDGGTLSFTLASLIAETDHLIIVDAAELGTKPGTLRPYIDAAIDQFLSTTKRSAHTISLTDLIDIARLTNSLPTKRAFIGIQPGKIEWGNQLSSQVNKAIPKAATYIIELANLWNAPLNHTTSHK